MSFLPIVKGWLWVSTAAVLAGWLLSAFGSLNLAGYAISAAIGGTVWWLFCRSQKTSRSVPSPRTRRLFRPFRGRFTRFLPAAFFVLAALALLGGLLYAPTNHTGLTYRTPRVLQWLSEEQWFWIHTPSYRMNNRTCGFEWLSAPLFLALRSDRLLFLLNFIPFLLMPGLVFSVFTRLGIRARVAWSWMWLLPTGYCFLLQAGSIGNDAFPTAYALAAVDFALRARISRRVSDLVLSFLAAALLTGAKVSNGPLLLTWGLLILPLLTGLIQNLNNGTQRTRLIWFSGGLVLLLVCTAISFLPTALLNYKFCEDWTGLRLERAGMDMQSPIVGLWGNALLFLLHNFAPPFFPQAGWWNQAAPNLLPGCIVRPMNANFEAGYHLMWELPTEDWVGLGFGLSVLVSISFLAAMFLRRAFAPPGLRFLQGLPRWIQWGALVAPWIALGLYSVKSGMVTGSRIIAPYYPLLLPLLLVHQGQAKLVRKRWWGVLAGGVVCLTLPVLVVSPARPLWPAQSILSGLAKARPDGRLIQRAHRVYSVYSSRSDPLAQVRDLLPSNLRVIGFLADGDDMDISLWRPFFSRRVHHILWDDSAEAVRTRGIEYAVVGGAYLRWLDTPTQMGSPSEEPRLLRPWLERMNAEVLSTKTVTLKVSEGPQPWYVVRFNNAVPKQP